MSRRACLPKDEIELVMDQLSMNIRASSIRALIRKRTGINLSTGQIASLRQSLYTETVLSAESPAERLVQRLQESTNIIHRVYTGSLDEAGSITLYSRKDRDREWHPEPLNTESSSLSSHRPGNNDEVGTGQPPLSGPPSDNAKDAASRVIRALSLSAGQKVLLCCAWLNQKQLRYFEMYPTTLSFDVTFGTNAEKRPLARVTLITPSQKTVPVMNVFLPSQAEWVFQWIFQHALPSILPLAVRKRVFLAMTDQDHHCYSQIVAAQRKQIFPNLTHRLCKWHKIDRHFILKARSYCREGPGKRYDQKFVKTCRDWFYLITNKVETPAQEEHCLQALKVWMDKQSPAATLKAHARDYLKHKFEPYLHKLSFRFFFQLPGGDLATNLCEVDNSSLKRDVMGPNPLLGVDRSLNAIDQHSTRRIEDLERTAMDRLTRCWYLESDPKKLKGFNAFDKKKLTDRLILRTADRVYDNWLQGRNNYEYCEWDQVVEEKRAFFVRRRYSEQELKSIENGKNALPVYVNSRIVATVYHYKDGNPMGMSFHCSCHQFQRTNGIPCRHIYCVWDVKPLPEHCGVMHLKMYETNYGINDAATAQFQEEMNSGKHGPIFGKDNSELKLLECTKRELTGESRKWFVGPWNEVTVLNNKYVDEASMKDLRDREEEIGPLYGFNLHEMAPPTEVTSDYDDCGQQDEYTEEEEDSVGGLPEPGRRITDGYQALVNLPSFGTLAEMVSRGRDVISINEVFLAAQERILREQNEIRGAEHRNNSVVSSQFETAEGPYERAAPALSPSRTRKRKH
jgi:hypothetical protein